MGYASRANKTPRTPKLPTNRRGVSVAVLDVITNYATLYPVIQWLARSAR